MAGMTNAHSSPDSADNQHLQPTNTTRQTPPPTHARPAAVCGYRQSAPCGLPVGVLVSTKRGTADRVLTGATWRIVRGGHAALGQITLTIIRSHRMHGVQKCGLLHRPTDVTVT